MSLAVFMLGCGQVGFDIIPRDAALDGSTDVLDAALDADFDAGAPECPWTGLPVLGDVVSLDSVNTTGFESDPFLTDDLLTLYFVSSVLGSSDVFQSLRANTASPFGVPQPVPGLADPEHDETLIFFVDPGMLTGVHSSTRGGGLGESDLFIVSRPSASAPFDSFVPIPGVNSSAQEFDPTIDPRTGDLYFASNRDGTLDLFRAPRVGASWGPPVPVVGLNTSGDNQSALTFAPGGDHVLFQTGSDVLYARHMGDGNFVDVTPIPGITSASLEAEPEISPDGCEVYFIRDIAGRNWDLHRALLAR